MKTQINFFIALYILLISSNVFSQEYNDMIVNPNIPARTEYDAFNTNGQPITRTQQVAIVYIDFPDGRYLLYHV